MSIKLPTAPRRNSHNPFKLSERFARHAAERQRRADYARRDAAIGRNLMRGL